MHSLAVLLDHQVIFSMLNDDDDDVHWLISNWVLRLMMMSVVLYLPVMIKAMMVHLSMNLNWVHSYHWNIVIVELVDDVASLNVFVNDVDSSSNWQMMVVVELVWRDHKHFHDDDKVHDDVDNEMY
jgi:hypothetical protein